VGQKIHPSGFRIGINKSYNSIWFANYGAFSKVLEEDYKIRNLFKKKWSTLEALYRGEGGGVGVVKLKIQRKIHRLELILNATRPEVITIASKTTQTNFFIDLKNSLKFLVKDSKQIQITVLKVTEREEMSSLVARSIANELEKRVAFKKALRKNIKMLQERGVEGFKIQVSGRLDGVEIARSEWAREGRVPLQTLKADINYAAYCAHTIYGAIGIKVWIFRKKLS
jgi:small subunit ribosomal protein S3